MKKSKITDEQLRDALKRAGGNRTTAAMLLGVAKQTVYTRLRIARERGDDLGSKAATCQAIAALWQSYAADHDNVDLRNRLVEAYLPIAQRAAAAVSFSLPKHVDQGVILSGAQMALLRLVESFDPARGAAFTTYCQRRLHGAAIDELRAVDSVPRQVRRRERVRQPAIEELAKRLGHWPTDEEIFDEIGDLTNAHVARRTVSLSNPVVRGKECEESLPLGDILGAKTPRETKHWFAEVTRSMDMDQKTAVYLHYAKGHTMREVGNALGLSESRISQMLSSAFVDLKKKGLEKLLSDCPL